MRALVHIFLCSAALGCANAQCGSPLNTADAKKELNRREQIAYKLDHVGDFENELKCRMQLSKLEWQVVAQTPRALDKYDLWGLLAENDLPLAFLLEGKHQWEDAESMYRHSQQQLAKLKVAGNDVKSENELGLAHLISSMGKTQEAQKVCSHWKNRVPHNADYAINAVKTNVPTPPLADTREVEIGRWDLACGNPQAGEDMLRTQIVAHPDMLAPYTALGNYYLETGAFPRALELSMQERHLWNRAKN